MAKVITNGELASIINDMLTNPNNSVIDDKEQFEGFITSLAEVVANHAGGSITKAGYFSESEEAVVDFKSAYCFCVKDDGNLPDVSVWDDFDKEGDLERVETSPE